VISGPDVASIGLGDGLALDARLLAADRDRLLDLLGLDVLHQPRGTALRLRGTDMQLLLGAGHRLVATRALLALAAGLAFGNAAIGATL
jgi:hypothetical protein